MPFSIDRLDLAFGLIIGKRDISELTLNEYELLGIRQKGKIQPLHFSLLTNMLCDRSNIIYLHDFLAEIIDEELRARRNVIAALFGGTITRKRNG